MFSNKTKRFGFVVQTKKQIEKNVNNYRYPRLANNNSIATLLRMATNSMGMDIFIEDDDGLKTDTLSAIAHSNAWNEPVKRIGNRLPVDEDNII